MLITNLIARLRPIAQCGLAAFLAATGTAGAQTDFAILHQFQGNPAGCINRCDGAFPQARLIMDGAGNLYGTTFAGGNNGFGTVFELVPPSQIINRGWTEFPLYSFCQQSGCADGKNPQAGLITDGTNLYGTTVNGGSNNLGTVFKFAPANGAWTPTVLYSFAGGSKNCGGVVDGSNPWADLIMDLAGNLYGTTNQGGSNQFGTVFKLTFTPTPPKGGVWDFCTLHGFAGGSDGGYPAAGLIFDAGELYGTTTGSANSGTVFNLAPSGGTWTSYNFFCPMSGSQSGCVNGRFPYAGLMMGGSGNLYGTTLNGGSSPNCSRPDGCGTVFELTPQRGSAWTPTVLYSFCSQSGCADGSNSYAGLIMDGAGNLYGTTILGGSQNAGTVFKLAPSGGAWTPTVLHNFCSESGCADGASPYAGLIYDKASGTLYGTTMNGGASSCQGGCGVVFAVDTGYKLTVSVSGDGTVTSQPPGISCPSPNMCSAYFAPGTTVILTEKPAATSWNFTQWGDACSGSGQCAPIMNAAKQVSATFTFQ